MLSDARCRAARGQARPYKLADDRGLFLFVTPTGFRSWRMKYRHGGKERQLTFGGYPEISLVAARQLRDDARSLLRAGRDPMVERRQKQAAIARAADDHFRAVATEWHTRQLAKWRPRYARQILQRLENDVFPSIGSMPIVDVTAALVLQLLRKVEDRGSREMAHRVRQHVSDIFAYAIATGRATDDPAHAIRKALAPLEKGMRPARLRIDQARCVLATIESADAYAMTKLASRLLALTAARPGVIRLASPGEFEELDGASPLWRIPADKMKLSAQRRRDANFEFVVPLSPWAVDVVRTAIGVVGRDAPLLFPALTHVHRPISDNTLSKLYRQSGFRGLHVPHGWRATFSTIMNERAAIDGRDDDRQIIDLMLAHVREGVEAAYNRALYMPRRRELACEWADLLMTGMPPAASLLRGH